MTRWPPTRSRSPPPSVRHTTFGHQRVPSPPPGGASTPAGRVPPSAGAPFRSPPAPPAAGRPLQQNDRALSEPTPRRVPRASGTGSGHVYDSPGPRNGSPVTVARAQAARRPWPSSWFWNRSLANLTEAPPEVGPGPVSPAHASGHDPPETSIYSRGERGQVPWRGDAVIRMMDQGRTPPGRRSPSAHPG